MHWCVIRPGQLTQFAGLGWVGKRSARVAKTAPHTHAVVQANRSVELAPIGRAQVEPGAGSASPQAPVFAGLESAVRESVRCQGNRTSGRTGMRNSYRRSWVSPHRISRRLSVYFLLTQASVATTSSAGPLRDALSISQDQSFTVLCDLPREQGFLAGDRDFGPNDLNHVPLV